MPRLGDAIDQAADALRDRYGDLPPAEPPADPFDAVLTAFLGQWMIPRQVAGVREFLREQGLLDPAALAVVDPAQLTLDFRLARVVVAPRTREAMRRIARWFADREERGDATADAPTETLRDELTAINGVGAASADGILLRGLGRPVYPVDRGSHRILVRHGWTEADGGYDEARSVVEGAVGDDPAALARTSFWFESAAGDYCRVSTPKCDSCPLQSFLPPGGPDSPED